MGIRRFWDQHLGCRLDKPSKGADLGGNTGDLHIHISITEDVVPEVSDFVFDICYCTTKMLVAVRKNIKG